MTILAGILSLGNIAFETTDSDALKVSETSRGWLKATAVSFLFLTDTGCGSFTVSFHKSTWRAEVHATARSLNHKMKCIFNTKHSAVLFLVCEVWKQKK